MSDTAPELYPLSDDNDVLFALRGYRSPRAGRIVWAIAYALCMVIGWALLVFVPSAVIYVSVHFLHSYPSLTPGDYETARKYADSFRTGIIIGAGVLAIAAPILAALLWYTGPRTSPPAPSTSREPQRIHVPRPRLTRREARQRRRVRNKQALIALAVGTPIVGVVVVVLLSWTPWASGVSALGRAGRLLGVVGLGLLVELAVLLSAVFAFLVVMAAWALVEMTIIGGIGVAWVFTHWLVPASPLRSLAETRPATPKAQSLPETVVSEAAVQSDLVAQPPRRGVPGERPSASLLTYLFADRFVARDTIFRFGAPVPCSTSEVKMNDLAATLFAVAFWDLARIGCLSLEIRRAGLFKRPIVDVRRVREELAPGLEGVLLHVPNIDPEAFEDEDTAGKPGPLGRPRNIVRTWLGYLQDPEWKIIETVLAEGTARGVFRVAEEQEGRTQLETNCEAVDAQRSHMQAFEKAWRGDSTGRPELQKLLIRDCGKAIKRARVLPESEGTMAIILGAISYWCDRGRRRPWPKSPPIDLDDGTGVVEGRARHPSPSPRAPGSP